jgi:hypothetical protein
MMPDAMVSLVSVDHEMVTVAWLKFININITMMQDDNLDVHSQKAFRLSLARTVTW